MPSDAVAQRVPGAAPRPRRAATVTARARPAAGSRADRVADRVVPVALVAQAAALLVLVAPMLTRPLWYNEQWRAWYLSRDAAPFQADPETPAPMSFGFAALARLATAVLGRDEAALRAPSAVALLVLGVLAYRLARRWLGVRAATLTATALLLNRLLVTFGAELAPYTVEAACVVGVLLCWLGAQEPEVTPAEHAYRYCAMGALALVATPAVLVLGPLLAVDAVRAARSRVFARLVPPAATGVTALAHLALYVMPQSKQRHGPYWEDYFLPAEPAAFLGGLWRGLASYVPGALTGGTAHVPSVADGEVAFPLVLRAVLILLMTAVLVAGTVAGLRDPRTRPLPVALLGCLALQAAGSLHRAWPFGFTRVNAFLLPLGYLVAAVGTVRLGAALRTRGVTARGKAVAGLAAYALVVAVGARQVATLRAEAPGPAFGTSLERFVAVVRERATPRDVVVLVHQMTEKGWNYYMHVREGGVGPRLPERQSILVSQETPDAAGLAGFLAAHRDAVHVYVVAVRGTPAAAMRVVHDAVRAGGYVRAATWREPDTGGLAEYVAAAAARRG